MIDDSTNQRGDSMKKFSFNVDVVGEANVESVLSAIRDAVKGHGTYNCLKVWTKRKIGVSLAAPKAKKASPKKETATATATA
jgi:hypothetical protein